MNYLYALAFYCVNTLPFLRPSLFLFLSRWKQGQSFVVLLFFSNIFALHFRFSCANAILLYRTQSVMLINLLSSSLAFGEFVPFYCNCVFLFFPFHADRSPFFFPTISISSALNAIPKLINGREKKRERKMESNMRGKWPTERTN